MNRKFYGCDEDCFNCPYPDCYKPGRLTTLQDAIVPDFEGVKKSESKHYTLELSGLVAIKA